MKLSLNRCTVAAKYRGLPPSLRIVHLAMLGAVPFGWHRRGVYSRVNKETIGLNLSKMEKLKCTK